MVSPRSPVDQQTTDMFIKKGILVYYKMSYQTLEKSPKLRGRPKRSGILKDPIMKSTVPAKLSPTLIAMIQPERRENESYSDTIYRLLSQKGKRIGKLQKKVDALEERLAELKFGYDAAATNKQLEPINTLRNKLNLVDNNITVKARTTRKDINL